MTFGELDIKAVNTIRCLGADMPSKANSGHPGAPMGLAPLAHVLFQKYMNFNPKNPEWFNRDRFVLSNGHACCLQYSLLHLYGYDYSTQDLENFRQIGSKTPGHPERELPGIEVTTGPLGQGIANAVGLAIAQKHIAATYGKPGFEHLFDNHIYSIFGDGCMMEGVASEAMSLAGHLQLNNLIAFYDDNHITIDGDTKVAFTEDVMKRLEAYGWNVLHVKDGDSDLQGIADAIEKAQTSKDKPTVIKVTTTIGFGSKMAGTHSVHGSPLKADDLAHLKKSFGFDPEKSFFVPDDVQKYYNEKAAAGAELEAKWEKVFAEYAAKYPAEAKELKRRIAGELPAGWEKELPTYTTEDPAIASRKLSETVLTKIHQVLPELIGGSADLTGSNLTRWKDAVDFQPPATGLGDYSGRYIRYGVREHGMGAIMNGIHAYGGFVPYGGTFLNFVSYAAGAVRLSALSQQQVIWVATHDSIGLGEDGPTHQPIETLAHFRATPNISVWRPADGNETSAAYYSALTKKHTPTIIALSRQNLPQLAGSTVEKALKGAYTAVDTEGAEIILISTGSEVGICVDAVKVLADQGIKASVVSIPDWFTFEHQSKEYKLSVLPDGIPVLSVEVMSSMGWSKWSHAHFSIDTFGKSGPYKKVYEAFHFTPEGIAERAAKVTKFYKGTKLISPINQDLELH